MNIGDVISFGKHSVNGETPWPIFWRIIGKNHANYPSNSVTLISDQIIDMRAFDAKEPDNPNNDRKNYGNNEWSSSNIRQWLNSSADSGEWYTPQHGYDSPPTDELTCDRGTRYDNQPGFLFHFTEAERNLITQTTIKTTYYNESSSSPALTETTDKVFLLSRTEIGLGDENNASEGSPFEYFDSDASRIVSIQRYAYRNTLSNFKPIFEEDAWFYWLRTPNTANPDDTRGVNTDGTFGNNDSNYGHDGIRPCINLPMSAPIYMYTFETAVPAIR